MDAPGHLDEELNSTSPGGTVRNWAHVPPFNPATAKVGIILPPGRTDLGLAMPSEQERLVQQYRPLPKEEQEAMQAKLREVKARLKDPNNCRKCHKAFDGDTRIPVAISCGCKSICLSCEQRLTELGYPMDLLRYDSCIGSGSSMCTRTNGKTMVDVR